MTPKTTAKKAEPDTSTVQTTEVKEAPAKTTVRKTRTTAKKTTEKPAAEKKPATEKKPAARRTVKKEVNAEVYVQFLFIIPGEQRMFLNKNVPWHILAPSAVACDKLPHRASAHRWQVVPIS